MIMMSIDTTLLSILIVVVVEIFSSILMCFIVFYGTCHSVDCLLGAKFPFTFKPPKKKKKSVSNKKNPNKDFPSLFPTDKIRKELYPHSSSLQRRRTMQVTVLPKRIVHVLQVSKSIW